MHELKGTIKTIGNLEQVSPKFRKRTLMLETVGKYPQLLAIEFVNDKVDMLNGYNVGDGVTVSINIMGKEWQGKHFTNLSGWKIDKGAAVSNGQQNPDRQSADIPF
tara:strand:- start:1667 stop:1984 length:318 start_codon:yes stop_codon:yes gene_type:complete